MVIMMRMELRTRLREAMSDREASTRSSDALAGFLSHRIIMMRRLAGRANAPCSFHHGRQNVDDEELTKSRQPLQPQEQRLLV